MSIKARKLSRIEDGKYVLNFQFDFANAAANNILIPGIFGGVLGGTEDSANMSDVNANIAIPNIKCVQGTVNFQQDLTATGGGVGPLLIVAPDTQEVIAISANRNTGGVSGAQGSYLLGTPVPGTVGHNFVSFCFPIHSASQQFRIIKLENPPDGSGIIKGYANLSFLTFDVAPYMTSF